MNEHEKSLLVAKDIINTCYETDHDNLMEVLLIKFVKEHYPELFTENMLLA